MSQDEREWVARLRAGDTRAFETLYRVYAPRVLGFALRLCGNRADAEDLTQDVFLAAYGTRSGFSGRSRLLTWLLGIAVRRWRDHTRAASRRPTEVLIEDGGPGTSGTGSRSSEDRVLEALELAEALQSLDPAFRAAVVLVFSQGLTYREAAEALGEPVGTVKWRVAEAVRRMRRWLEDREEQSDGLHPDTSGSDRTPCGR
jgi:RNA polymerase sigma-70 factor, ECF subfamily